MIEDIANELTARVDLYRRFNEHMIQPIIGLSNRIANSMASGGKLLTCGNGGSAAEAQHLAEELVGRFRRDRRPLPAIALTADSTALTCIANDFGYQEVFARQVEALARPGDVVLAFTTSGRSLNLLRALEAAREVGATTAALLGEQGGPLYELCDCAVLIPSNRTDLIQEAQLMVIHLLCTLIERRLGLA